MEENTQLPKEVVEEIKTNAALRCDRDNGKDDNSFRNGYYSGYVSGATAYASKLQSAEGEHKRLIKTLLELEEGKRKGLEQWKSEAREILNSIWEYADSLNVPLGASKTEAVISHAKELERQNEKMKRQATGWRPLLEDILREDDNNIAYISVDLINKIKTFLYGE